MFVIKSLITLAVQRPVACQQIIKNVRPIKYRYRFTCFRLVTTLTDNTINEVEATETGALQTTRPPLPIMTQRQLQHSPVFTKPRQAWIENLDMVETVHLGTVTLHPLVFAGSPRLDILQRNVVWQQLYRRVSYATTKTRADVRGGGRKPWPQKGTGRARHGSIRSPLWRKGGIACGPRGPKSYYYMLSFWIRLKGLITALSMKFAQDDLHIIDSLEIPTNDPKFLENLVEHRGWGPSVLFIDEADVAPHNFALATSTIQHINVMPVYGLNVYSMLKHDTLVLTLAALEKIEERILFQLNRRDVHNIKHCAALPSP